MRPYRRSYRAATAGHFSIGKAKQTKLSMLNVQGDQLTCIPDAIATLLHARDPSGAPRLANIRAALANTDGSLPSYGDAQRFLKSQGMRLKQRGELTYNELALFRQPKGVFMLDLKIHVQAADGTIGIDGHCVAFEAARTATKYTRTGVGCITCNAEKPWFVEESDRTNQTTARAVFTNGLYGGQREGGETVIKVKMPRVFELVDL